MLAKFADDANLRVLFNAFKAQADSKRSLSRLEAWSNLLRFKKDKYRVLLLEGNSPGTSTGARAGLWRSPWQQWAASGHQPTVTLAATMTRSSLGCAKGQRQSPPEAIISLYTALIRHTFNIASSLEPPGRREVLANFSIGFGFTEFCRVVGHLMLPKQNIFFFL